MYHTNSPPFFRSSSKGFNRRSCGAITMGLVLWLPSIDGSNGRNRIIGWANGGDGNTNIQALFNKQFHAHNTPQLIYANNQWLQTTWLQNNVTEYTIMAWIKTMTPSGVLVNDRGSGAGMSLTLAIPPSCGGSGSTCPGNVAGVPGFGLDSNGIWIGMGGMTYIADGHWHHVAGTFYAPSGSAIVPSNFNVYVDGKLDNGLTGSIGSATSPLTGLGGTAIGYHQAWDSYFNGSMYDVRIYVRALSENEIYQVYNGIA